MMARSQFVEVFSGLILFLVFTVSMLFVLLFGATAYKNISTELDRQYRERTVLNYIAAKVRYNKAEDNVQMSDISGVAALTFEEEIEGVLYLTYVYFYDGYLRELYTPKGTQLSPDSGDEILPIDNLVFTPVEDKLVKVVCEVNGRTEDLLLNLR